LTDAEMVLKLIIAAALGGIVGLERESLNRPAGFRTHILVCMGSALIMMVSVEVFRAYQGLTNPDPGRIAAQVVSGIGFLGAGTILREGATIRGLTTAASLWVIAGIGLAVGVGLYIPATVTAFMVLLTLLVLSRLEHLFVTRHHHYRLLLDIADRPGMLGRVGTVLGSHDVNIVNVILRPAAEPQRLEAELEVRLPADVSLSRITAELGSVDGVHSVNQQG